MPRLSTRSVGSCASLLLIVLPLCPLQAAMFSDYTTVPYAAKRLTNDSTQLQQWLLRFSKEKKIHFIYDPALLKGKYVSNVRASSLAEVTQQLQQAGLRLVQTGTHQYVIQPVVVPATSVPAGRANLAMEPAAAVVADKVVKGVVKDQLGTPLPGVSVKVSGRPQGVITDVNGQFQLSIPEGASLEFSFIGYQQQTVTVGAQTELTVVLAASSSSLNEVLVVGYGAQKKVDVIGSVSQLSATQLNNRPVTQVSNALTGQMPGVTVIQRSGRPGNSGGAINVRGVGSFGAASGALILVDGIPTSSFNDIDPNDIETISVLKDASSAAIYGARAANGVILVTTKSGKEGKTKVSYNGYVGIQRATAYPKFVNSWDYAQLYNEATNSTAYTPADIQKFRDGSDRDNFPNTDFIKSVFSRSGVQTGHNLSLSGGGKTNQYVLSLGYLSQDGIVVKNNYSRYNLRFNMTSQINDKLKLTTRLAGISTVTNEPAPPATLDFNDMVSIIGQSVRYPAIYADKLSNGYYGVGVVQKGTPVSWLESESFYKERRMDLNANLRLDWQVISDLKLSLIGGYNQVNFNNKRFLATQRVNANILLGPNQLNQNNNTTYYKTVQALAEYNKHVGRHQVGVLAGYSLESSRLETLAASRDKLPGNSLTELGVGAEDNQKANGGANEWGLQSVFGRVRYNYDSRYLLEAVARFDGSSRFPTSRKYAFFPSVAVGWRISQENFMKDHVSWVNELKLKASIGTLGNQNITNSNGQEYYPYQNTLVSGSAYSYPFGGVITSGAARTTLTDSTLQWESTRTTDVGIEGSLFKSKLNFGVTYFDRYTYDILYSPSASVSAVLGYQLSPQNTGRLKNTGWEFSLGYNDHVGDLTYRLGGNLSIINNKVLDLGVGNIRQLNGMVGNGSNLFIGYPMSMYYGYVSDGLFTNADDVKNWADQRAVTPNAKPGDIRYRDISGPDGKPDGKVDATYDRVFLGSSIPKYTFGLNLGADYKGFDISVLLQGVTGVKGYLDNTAGWAFYNTASVQQWQMDERWTAANPDRNAGYPRLELIPNSGTPNTVVSSFWAINGSYLRVKNVQLGYGLPKALLQRMRIESLRFYVSGENLYTWSRYRKGWDPEINTSGAYYPILANYTFGVNVKF
ncbi:MULTISPECIES: TonB-dependent receptor [Chitinophaga]|uniref:SusC/RagA family TonB-linked outer membrane protein n=1 Tax=Chitinophaga TaxID=79328 RepID=UPI0018DF542F|nr:MULTISPECIES: TonB-dependent receptor [Chitinophaga]